MKTATLIIAIFSMFLGACGSATAVRQDTLGGRIQLDGSYMSAMGDARLMAAEACGGRFELVEHDRSVDYLCTDARTTTLASNHHGARRAQ